MRALGFTIGCALTAALMPMIAAGDAAAAPATAHPPDLGHQVLGANDGWAADGAGTTGGSAADAAHTYTVHDRAGLVAALAGGSAVPKIIYVDGTVDANDGAGAEQYRDPGYDLASYLATYDPAVWGRAPLTGPLEEARVRSQKNQAARVVLPVGANTTIAGLGRHARIVGGDLTLKNVDNVIVRNLEFQDAYDYFPAWDPTDGSTGNWNSQYDTVTLTGATHVWVDHCTFDDGARPDSTSPVYFGQRYQHHDGLLDITKVSDLVTVSWNRFTEHDKTMLIGSSDSATADNGHLRVTLHDNLFDGVFQRAPRVRYGQVHVYNNLYVAGGADYVYSWGVGVSSHLYAENNALLAAPGFDPALTVHAYGGTALHATGTELNGRPLDVLAAYNAAHPDAPLAGDVGWQPVLHGPVLPTAAVPVLVAAWAGAGRLPATG
jgi:pectate lyase